MIWLASYPKSGNTWARILLESYLRRGGAIAINRLRGTEYAAEHYVFSRITGIRPRYLLPAEILPMRHAAFLEAGRVSGRYHLFKTHENNLRLEGGRYLYPVNARQGALVLIRHPYDVAVSYGHFSQGQAPDFDLAIDILNNADFRYSGLRDRFPETLGDWSTHTLSWTKDPTPHHVVIRYEDMLQDTAHALRRMLQLLIPDTPPEPAWLHDAIHAASFTGLRQQEARDPFIERPASADSFFRAGCAGSGREVLSPGQRQRIWQRHHRVMTAFGYQEDGSVTPALHPQKEDMPL